MIHSCLCYEEDYSSDFLRLTLTEDKNGDGYNNTTVSTLLLVSEGSFDTISASTYCSDETDLLGHIDMWYDISLPLFFSPV